MTLPFAYLIALHILAFVGLAALMLAGTVAYALWNLRDEVAEPNPPRMGDMGDELMLWWSP